jgi:hypothetical protein
VQSIAYYALLRKGDNRIFPNYSLSNSSTQSANWPSLAVSNTGMLVAAYEVKATEKLAFTYSTDGGNNWSRNTPFPGGVSRELVSLAFDASGTPVAVWQEDVADGGDIYFSKITGLPAVTRPGAVQPNIADAYEPGKTIMLRWSQPAGMKLSRSTWYTVTIDESNLHRTFTTRDLWLAIDSLPVGLYSYRITAHTAFDSSATTGIFAVATLSVGADQPVTDIRIYPNPVPAGSSKINILLTGFSQSDLQVRLYDMRGNVIDLTNVRRIGEQLVIDAKEIMPGVYHCEIVSGKSTWSSALVVE